VTGKPLSLFERLRAIASDPGIVAAADVIELHDLRNGGRPRHYNAFHCLLAFVMANSVFQTVRRTETELADPTVWRKLRKQVKKAWPDRRDLWLPKKPIRRHHILHFRDTYLSHDEGVLLLQQKLAENGLALCELIGLGGEKSGRSISQIDLRNCLEADGKVISPASRHTAEPVLDRSTGELRVRRFDPDVKPFKVGGREEKVRGHKQTVLSTRGPGYLQRVVLGIEDAAAGAEPDSVLGVLDRVTRCLHWNALIYDGALRGTHFNRLLQQFGMIGIAPAIADEVDKHDPTIRTEKQLHLGDALASYGDGATRSIELWAVGGWLCESFIDADGERQFIPLTQVQRRRIRNKTGGWRLYGDHRTHDGATVRIRYHESAEDRQAKRGRMENLRPVAPGSDEYKRLYGRRNDTESANRQREDSLWQGRSNCYTRRRTLLSSLGWAFGQNAVCRYATERQRSSP
jgi:hypothetical protein